MFESPEKFQPAETTKIDAEKRKTQETNPEHFDVLENEPTVDEVRRREDFQKLQGEKEKERLAQIETVREELKKQLWRKSVEPEPVRVSKPKEEEIDEGERVVARYMDIPFRLISAKDLKEESYDGWRWRNDEGAKSAMARELEKRKNESGIQKAFSSTVRFVGGSVYKLKNILRGVWENIRERGFFEERSPEEVRERIERLKQNPFFRKIGEAIEENEEKK